MKSLESLDLSSNKLKRIPLSIGLCYKSLSNFLLDGNPLNSDFAMLWSQISFVKSSSASDSVSHHSKRSSKSSFDDYLNSRLKGTFLIFDSRVFLKRFQDCKETECWFN